MAQHHSASALGCGMSNFPRKAESRTRSAELAETLTPSNVEFFGEQSGPGDDQIKTRMRSIFERTPRVIQRAYLARLRYGDPAVSSVVLCVRHIENIEQTLLKGFKHMFGEIRRSGDFYDWMIIGEEQERELRKVCKPFYETAQAS